MLFCWLRIYGGKKVEVSWPKVCRDLNRGYGGSDFWTWPRRSKAWTLICISSHYSGFSLSTRCWSRLLRVAQTRDLATSCTDVWWYDLTQSVKTRETCNTLGPTNKQPRGKSMSKYTVGNSYCHDIIFILYCMKLTESSYPGNVSLVFAMGETHENRCTYVTGSDGKRICLRPIWKSRTC